MFRTVLRPAVCVALGLLLFAGGAFAQTGLGTLSGYVTDPDGAPLPGVTMTATSEVLMGERVAYTDSRGYFRLANLPPGVYAIQADLAGFTQVIRGDILMRAGASFRADLQMELGGVEETITVTAETPMLDISKPGQVLTIDGDFQRAIPVQSRKNWSDFLELTPGVHARPFDDGSGRMVYFGHGTEHFAHVIQLEGQNAAAYRDAQPTYIQMSTDMLADIEVRSSGQEAKSPIGTGLVINVVTKSGGNQFHGSLGYNLQPIDWNGDNSSPEKENPSTPTIQKINQLDYALGGPIARDKVWFFTSGRWSDNEAGISRTAEEVARLRGFDSGWEEFNNFYEGFFPYLKLTAQLGRNHTLAGYYQYDRTDFTGDREYHTDPRPFRKTGGALYGGKLTSIWGSDLTTDFSLSYNDKTSSYQTLGDIDQTGPWTRIDQESFVSGGRRTGTGRLLEFGRYSTQTVGPSTVTQGRGDITYFTEGFGGAHEFQTGFFAGFYTRESNTVWLNGGAPYREYHQLIDPNNLGGGTIAYRKIFASPNAQKSNDMSDRDIGLYIQDNWNVGDRLTINAGVRVDFVRRFDNLFDLERMNDVAVGPRFGASYMLTSDAKNILRAGWTRVHEQVNGRDSVSSQGFSSRVSFINAYDLDLNGTFETEFFTPAVGAELTGFEFDPDLHQPWVDEIVVGYRRQFLRDFAFDIAYIRRVQRDRYGQVDVNGIYPDGPGQPFIGFGLVDPNRGRMLQRTNGDWSDLVYNAIELTATKRLSNNWQFLASVSRQWHHLDGTWNPTDPARFIEPEKFENSSCIWQPRGGRDDNSYQLGTNSTYCPTWRNYSIRIGGTYTAPWDVVLNANFTLQDGPWSGPILTRIAAGDPIYGPPTVTSSTGVTQSNPLATRIRFKNSTRDEGQQKLPDAKFFNVRVGKRFNIKGTDFEAALNIFNLFNLGDFQQYTYNGANQDFNPNFLQGRSLQAARAYQLAFTWNF